MGMTLWPRRVVALVNARVAAASGMGSSLRFASRVLEIDGPPRRGDTVVDLDGAFVLPGLINAHDHLELNHYGPLKGRDRYESASAWIDDMRPRLQSDPAIRANRAFPLRSRLFIGGLKNLLAGVTTVAHHNPLYPGIHRAVPVRVLRWFGWAHSFLLQGHPVGARGEPGGDVAARCRATPPHRPFIIHAGEGCDEAAAREVGRLDEIGCLGPNTVLVHGVTITPAEWTRIVARGASLVWCPASNEFLFGRTPPVRQLLDVSEPGQAHVCLGSDSRLTGARDLLDELRAASRLAALTPRELLRMVTTAPADVLRLPDAGRLRAGSSADLIVIPSRSQDAAEALMSTSRRDLALVAIGGRPLVGAPALADVFSARRTDARSIVVDGVPRLAESRLARAIEMCPIREPGVECR
jgi:cytosine/adenosine deaminase-related metal-dependent hydrolase